MIDDDDFFGRPRSSGATTTLDPRPAPRPASSRSAAPRPRPQGRSGTRTAPRSAPRSTGRPSQARSASSPRTARATGPNRSGRPPLTGGELRTRTLRRLLALVVLMALLVAAIGVRLANIQLVASDRYVTYGESQRDATRALPAGRGAIYDRNGQAFAMSVAQPRVVADPSQIRHKVTTARALARILDLDPAEVEAKLRSTTSRYYQLIAPEATQEQADAIKAAQGTGDIEGVTFEDTYERTNPSGDLARGVVGHALPEGQKTKEGQTGGLSGVEHEYDAALRGKPGKLFYEQDVAGNPIAGGHRRLDPAQQGTDLYLTLDQALQYEAEQALGAQVTATGAQSGQAVIMRPSTGEILTMASVAAGEDGKVANTIDNRSVTSVFEPGSTNKMITVAGAIEDGVVAPDTVLDVPDHLTLYDKTFTDSHEHPESMWSVTDIVVTSSNIGTIEIARKLGKDRVDHYLRAFGFGTPSGLGFPGETRGIMKDPADWSGVDIGAIPIGQGIAVTALQMLSAYNVVANDGVYVAPKLVAATDHGLGQVPSEPSPHRRVISTDTARAMQQILAKVVSDGTGKQAAVPGFVPAGKTGTARIPQGVDASDGYLGADGRYHYQATFVGMVVGADLSIIVTVEDPKTSIFGADVAAPVFAHLAATALRRYQVPPPALAATRHAVPELSASARQAGGDDVTGGGATAQG